MKEFLRKRGQMIVNIFLFVTFGYGASYRAYHAWMGEKFDLVEALFFAHTLLLVIIILARRQHVAISKKALPQCIALAAYTATPLFLLGVMLFYPIPWLIFLIGIFAHLVESQGGMTAEMRLLLMVGLLGSFTTYSTFSSETMNLLQDQRLFLGLINIGTHIIIGLSAVLLGRFTIITIWR